ncbi:unnamed protein product [Durusdinium trenchii]|uniref:Uncharacterized protein n=2 Tax=Durusdinium trenchii TaxID=1381693 RepID=A0ABP0K1Y9_9DINO
MVEEEDKRVVVRETSYESQYQDPCSKMSCTRFCFEFPAQGAPRWTYMGQGQGAYVQVSDVQYVGEGNGDLVRETPRSVQLRPHCLATLVCLVLLMLGVLLWVVWQRNLMAKDQSDPWDCEISTGIAQQRFPVWKQTWSLEKQRFCCERYGRTCEEERRLSEEDQVAVAQVADDVVYECQVSVANWEAWPEAKKEWCCRREDLGCGFQCSESPDAWSPAKTRWCCMQQGKGCENPPTQATSAGVVV